MRIFVTGASGFIGSAVVPELLAAGHQVLGLARSDESAAKLSAAGAEVQRGALDNLDSLRDAVTSSDGVIHLAFIHDFSNYAASIQADSQAVGAMLDALDGSGKPFVGTSGTLGLSRGRLATEDDAPSSQSLRAATEELVIAAAGRGVRSSVIRLSPTVHGAGDYGFVHTLIDIARRSGMAAYVDGGENRWPAVHRQDAARLYRLALEQAAPGTRLNGVVEEGVPMRNIAKTIGEGLSLPVRNISGNEAPAHFTWLSTFVSLDSPASNAITRETLGWEPEEIGLLEDMRAHYFSPVEQV